VSNMRRLPTLLRMVCCKTYNPRSRAGGWTIVLLMLTAIAPINAAHAYVDPNSAGPLFQFLFPLLVAIASFLAACRRVIRQYWRRLTTAVMTSIRGDRAGPDTERPTDPR
jgi:hypothetical protein